jgi:glycosyltransferase involved in cell wall biosynthesis
MSDVTVVIPTIPPRSHLLQRAVASVHDQMVQPKMTVIEYDKNHEGAAVTRNRGLERVETEFVAFLDDDDELLPNHLELCLDEIERTGADLVYPWFITNSCICLSEHGYGIDTKTVRAEILRAGNCQPLRSDFHCTLRCNHQEVLIMWRKRGTQAVRNEEEQRRCGCS